MGAYIPCTCTCPVHATELASVPSGTTLLAIHKITKLALAWVRVRVRVRVRGWGGGLGEDRCLSYLVIQNWDLFHWAK